MTNFSMLIGSLMSIFGMGSGLVSQGASIHQQLNPQAQVYQQPGQRCAVAQNNTLLSGTIVVVQQDGKMVLQCVPDQRAQQ